MIYKYKIQWYRNTEIQWYVPSTEVVTGPGSFPAPHENTIGENLISWFTHFFKWFEQNTNTRNKFCVETRIIFSFTCNIGFHQKMQIMDWLEIRYLSSFLFLKNFFYFQNRLRLCCVQCWWARIKVEMLSCLLFPQLDCLDVELCHVSHFSLGGTHVTWAPPKKSKNFWWGHLFTESYQPW